MLSAVHTDRSARVFVSGDYFAAGFDGLVTVPLEPSIPLPPGSRLVPLPRRAEGIDRAGNTRALGRDRWSLAAVLPAGFTRTYHPAFRRMDADEELLAPLPYTAVAADENGELRVAALMTGRVRTALASEELERAVRDGLRDRPSNRLVKQLARCARDYQCVAAQNAFTGHDDVALVVASTDERRSDRSFPPVLTAWRPDEAPAEPAAFHPTSIELAEVAIAHLASGGSGAAFGHACEGDPLGAVRAVEDAIRRVRAETAQGTLRLETNGMSAGALRRLGAAGLDAVTVRLASARANTYDALHAPAEHRWADVRATLHAARDMGFAIEVIVLVFPGITDRPSEIDQIVALLGELPRATVAFRDLAADPRRALALAPSRERPLGVALAIARLHAQVPRAMAMA